MVSCRATSNHKVKETVALELSYVNSNLQLLKEELEELNSSMDVYQNDRWVWEKQPAPLGFHFSCFMEFFWDQSCSCFVQPSLSHDRGLG